MYKFLKSGVPVNQSITRVSNPDGAYFYHFFQKERASAVSYRSTRRPPILYTSVHFSTLPFPRFITIVPIIPRPTGGHLAIIPVTLDLPIFNDFIPVGRFPVKQKLRPPPTKRRTEEGDETRSPGPPIPLSLRNHHSPGGWQPSPDTATPVCLEDGYFPGQGLYFHS